jgi:hypothetical protein
MVLFGTTVMPELPLDNSIFRGTSIIDQTFP